MQQNDNSRWLIAIVLVALTWAMMTGKLDDLFKPKPDDGGDDTKPTPVVVDEMLLLKEVCKIMAVQLRAGTFKHSGELVNGFRNTFRDSVYGKSPTAEVKALAATIEAELKTALQLTTVEVTLDTTKSEAAAVVFDKHSK